MRPELSWLTARPIAHRGLHVRSSGVVENSLGAFSAAIAGNYTIECDLQISRDGEAVMFHDDTLDRVMEASGLVKSFTVAELKAMRFRHSAERIPTLGELLSLVDGKVPLVIELKPQWDRDRSLAVRTLELLSRYRGLHCVMSFDPDVIAAIKELSPGTLRGMVSDTAQDDSYDPLPARVRQELRTLGYLDRTAPDFLSLYYRSLPWAPVAALRARGMPIISWTIRSPQQARDALRYSDQITFESFLP
ncbi:MAG: glycerophosphodiester phosphodiesterase [Alphaproteobacteria bacterium]|nr:glycerophosphodiester phosphodiesterase [Alphaproteobacteria bacterium]